MVSLEVLFFIRGEPKHIPHFRYFELRLEHIPPERNLRACICFSYFSPKYVLHLTESRGARYDYRVRISKRESKGDACGYCCLSYSETRLDRDTLVFENCTNNLILLRPVPSAEDTIEKIDRIFLYFLLKLFNAYFLHNGKIPSIGR